MTTLLAVDDSSTMRKVLEITFAGEPYETLLASSPEEAMLKLGERRPPIALIDITLTPNDGYDLCRRVKSEFPETRVLLLASKQNPYDGARGEAAGADDHIDKPFETQALLDKVASVLDNPAASAPVGTNPIPAPAEIPRAPTPGPVIASRPASISTPSTPAIPSLNLRPTATAAARTTGPTAPIAPSPTPASTPSYHPVTKPAPSGESRSTAHTPAVTIDGLGPRLSDMGLSATQIEGVLALSKEVVEQVVWEVVPSLAEALIKEEIARLTKA